MKHLYLFPLRNFVIMPFGLLSSFIPRTLLAAGTGATLRALKSALLSLLLIAGAAHAVPVTWTLVGATFTDGTTLTGTFTYDSAQPSASGYSNWNVVVSTAGTTNFGTIPAFTYTTANSSLFFTSSTSVTFASIATPQHSVTLKFQSALTDTGTTTILRAIGNGDLSSNSGNQNTSIQGNYRILQTGSVSVAPTMSSIWIYGSSSINRGPTSGGTAVTITGRKFTGATGVTIGGSACTNVVVVSDTSITCTTPAGTAGAASVLVTTPDGTSAANPNAPWNYYVVPAPSVTSISSAFGPTAGGRYIFTVNGTNFKGDGYQATGLSFGGTPLTFGTGWSINNGSQIAVLSIPPGAAGSVVDITVTTVSGTSSTSAASQLTYIDPPTVTSVSPASGTTGTSVTITGTNFLGLRGNFNVYLGAQAVKFGTTNAASYSVDSATQITAIAPAGVTGVPVTISVQNPVGTGSSSTSFTPVAAPTVASVSPTSGSTAGGTSITITGTDLTGATGVTVGGATCTNVVVVSATSITCTTPAGTAGTAIVLVTTPAGTNAANTLYTYVTPAPAVTAVSPATGSTAGGTSITITGTNLTGATGVTVGGAACTNVVVVSATSITCTTPAGTAGTASILVTTPNGTNSANTLFTYVTPAAAAPIPTLSEWAMIFLASLMAMFALRRTRRQ